MAIEVTEVSAGGAAPVVPAAAPAAAAPISPKPAAAVPAEAPKTDAAKTTTLGGEPPKGTKAAPTEMEIKWPEGWKADAPEAGAYKTFAQKLGLNQAQAQEGVEFYKGVVDARSAAEEAELGAVEKQWEEALRADKAIGGSKFEASMADAAKAIDRFGSPELKAFLNETRLGNHPEMIKFALKVQQAIKEDSMAGKTGGNGAVDAPVGTTAEEWFPNTPSLHKRKE